MGKITMYDNLTSVVAKLSEGNPGAMNACCLLINEGYIMLSDGRYLPPKETVEQCFNAYGHRIGLLENWEKIYDSWMK